MQALRVLLALAALAGCWWLMVDRQQPPTPNSVPDAPTAPVQQPGRSRTRRPDRTEACLPAQPAAEDAQQEKAQATITGHIVRMEGGGGFAGCHVAFGCLDQTTGSSIANRVSPARVESSRIVPPCASTRRRQIARPRPVPDVLVVK